MPRPGGPDAGRTGPAHLVCPQFISRLPWVPRLCGALRRDRWSMGWAAVLCWLPAARCQPGPPPPMPGWAGVATLCLSDTCGLIWSILAPRQPVPNKTDEIYAATLGARLTVECRVAGQR